MGGKFGLGFLEGGFQLDRVDRRITGGKVVPDSRGEVADRKQPTVRRLGRVIPPPHSRAVSGLLDELENRLQKVHIVLRERIHRVQGWQRVLFQAVVADQAAHHRPVFLLDVATVVLAIRPGTGEGDGLFFAVVDQRTVDVGNAKLILSVSLHADASGSGLYGYAQPRWRLRRQVWAVSSNEYRSV